MFVVTKLEKGLVLAMAIIVLVSNVLVQVLLGDWLTYAAFTYPLAFLVTDIANRLVGKESARKVVLFGFVVGIACSFIGTQFVNQFGDPYVTVQVAIASGTAFLLSQLLDVQIFAKLSTGKWFKAPLVSSTVGSILDSLLFFTLAFSPLLAFLNPATDAVWAREMIPLLGFGFIAPLWLSLAVADFMVKISITLIALVPFRLLTLKFQKVHSGERQ